MYEITISKIFMLKLFCTLIALRILILDIIFIITTFRRLYEDIKYDGWCVAIKDYTISILILVVIFIILLLVISNIWDFIIFRIID